MLHAIVLSHDCEIDKQTRNRRIIVAPISLLDAIDDNAQRQAIIEQQRIAFIPLPEIPGLGNYYADLRSLSYVDRDIVDAASRMASMNEGGVVRLRVQLASFFTRKA
jgi:hypothetical protein